MAALSCCRAIESERTATREECEEKRRELEQSLVCEPTALHSARVSITLKKASEDSMEICLSEAE
jgi:hypothetical protein